MDKNERSFLSKIPDNVKVNICRWWLCGAIYFLLGLGTSLGTSDSALDLVFFLGIGIGIAHIFIFNPIVYSMFDIERNGKIVNKKYYERTILEGTFSKLAELLKCLICSFCVFFIYQFINLSIVNIFNLAEETVVLPGEPILYGLFFLIPYLGISAISNLVYKYKDKRNEKKIVNKNNVNDNKKEKSCEE